MSDWDARLAALQDDEVRYANIMAFIEPLTTRMEQDRAWLYENCQHEKTTERSQYYEGSYLDKATTDYWDECDFCHERLNKCTKTHSWYG